MKTFLNVLYRRILYKIPLKLLLILIAIFGILFACFSNASYELYPLYAIYQSNIGSYTINWDGIPDADALCITNNRGGTLNYDFTCRNNWETLALWNAYCISKNDYPNGQRICFNYPDGEIGIVYYSNSSLTVPYTSLQCQTEYNLIPISSVDSNYCTTNNLCPSQECPSVPIGTGNLTQLYINNILHVGAPTVLMNIPDEIDWDYAYTMGGNIMNIDIVGYNVDYQAVEDEINIQKYKPTGEELSLIVSNIIPLFVPGLCIILLLYFIFKFIKKVF